MIVPKILNVMKEIGPIIKDKTNEEKGFEYASLAAIIMKAREAMIAEKIIMFPFDVQQVVQKGNDVIMLVIYRFYDADLNEMGKNEYLDVKVVGEGCDKDGWAVYKALSGAYKYAITQTFAIPTVDDAEKDKLNKNDEDNADLEAEDNIEEETLNEENIEEMLGEPSVDDFENLFNLGESA